VSVLNERELDRGRALFSVERIMAYRDVAGVTYDDTPEYTPSAAPGEKRETAVPGICDQPMAPDGIYLAFQLPGDHIQFHNVQFLRPEIPAVAIDAVAFLREIETTYHP
jgi:hypothetical protein